MSPSVKSPPGAAGVTALLFDGETVEELTDWQDGLPRLGRSSIVWIDLEHPGDGEIRQLAHLLELTDETVERLREGGAGAQLLDFESYLHVIAFAPSGAGDRTLQRIVCLVSKHWIVTVHDAPLEALETFRERAAGSGRTGDLDGPEFLANVLEWVMQSYLEAFEEVERSLDEVDASAMAAEVSPDEKVLGRLIESRREIGHLRRALTSHREVVLALTRPELEAITSSGATNRFSALRERLEEAIQAARDSREAVVGSFDVLLATTGQRTNDVVRVLTLASVLLLPGSLIAGIFGMNFRLGFFDDASNFWPVLGLMAAVAAVTLVVARLRRWI